MALLKRFGIDAYMLMLIGMVVLGAVLPAQGIAAEILGHVTVAAIALLFFLYGVRMNAAEVMAGLTNWRLQGLSFGVTFVLFPILGIGVAWAARPLIGDELALGILFLAVLPSTINSSIALTGMAGGNVSGAICSATLSNLLGVFLTPALAAVLLHSDGDTASGDAVLKIALQILLPFVLGQCLRRWLSDFVRRRKMLTTVVDRGAILLIVYAAFSAGTVAGLWSIIPPAILMTLIAVVLVFLALGMVAVRFIGRIARIDHADRTALFFCGSTKSLASGLPIAAALFAPEMIGLMILPVMIFHMSQLLVCAVIAQRAAARVQPAV